MCCVNSIIMLKRNIELNIAFSVREGILTLLQIWALISAISWGELLLRCTSTSLANSISLIDLWHNPGVLERVLVP
jgi:hypothetical protein